MISEIGNYKSKRVRPHIFHSTQLNTFCCLSSFYRKSHWNFSPKNKSSFFPRAALIYGLWVLIFDRMEKQTKFHLINWEHRITIFFWLLVKTNKFSPWLAHIQIIPVRVGLKREIKERNIFRRESEMRSSLISIHNNASRGFCFVGFPSQNWYWIQHQTTERHQ